MSDALAGDGSAGGSRGWGGSSGERGGGVPSWNEEGALAPQEMGAGEIYQPRDHSPRSDLDKMAVLHIFKGKVGNVL